MLRISSGAIADHIGNIGETIFRARIGKFCDDQPYFSAHFLGEKFRIHDYLVNALDENGISAFFFAQVRATRSGFEIRKDGRRYLKVSASKDDIEAMARYPGPSYLFGIDIETEQAYFATIDDDTDKGFSALPTDFELSCENLSLLWSEVNAYWANRSKPHSSRFNIK